jgi:hypothetical protein
MPIRKCPLCLEVKEVVSSHFMPAAMYEYCTPPGGHPVAVTPKVVLESDRQLQDHLLCAACESCLNKGGESWVVPLLARLGGPFPFYDMLASIKPDSVEGDAKVYAAARNANIEVGKLIHFGMGIFFKGAVHSWSGSRTEPWIDLGPYTEPIRAFLRGEAGFPERMSLMVAVLPPPVKDISFCYPYRDSTRNTFKYRFYGCGITFILTVGKGMTKEDRAVCFSFNPHHPIFVTDYTDGIRMIFGEALRKTRKAKNVEKWLKR